MISTEHYPHALQLTQTIGLNQQSTLNLPDLNIAIPVDSVTSVYYCTQSAFHLSSQAPPEIQKIVYQNIDSAFWSFLHSLPCPIINPILAADHHNYKAHVLKQLHAEGIRVPKSIITNSPEAVKAFHSEVPHAILKPPWGQAFTEPFTFNHLKDEALNKLAYSPTLLQERIDGREIRVYVIGDELFGVSVQSDALDINEDMDARRVPISIPEELEILARKVANVTGLLFTAIDIRQSYDGEYVVLEANSSPDFTADEYQTEYPLADTLINVLLNPSINSR
jgi:glutathione synthase/RimK-type ligase-like ATP-grasp enzyme